MSYIPLPLNHEGDVRTAVGASQRDAVGNVITAMRHNSIVASFAAVPGQDNTITDIIGISTSGGGAATMAQGSATFSTGAAVTASVKGQTYTSVVYNPGFEVHCSFSAAFTTPTSANSSQLIGLWDDVAGEGFYMGFHGTQFGVTMETGGVATTILRSNFNGDKADGSASSLFRRDSVPEALNFTYLNLYRIRYSWWGSAPIVFEVMDPDGEWIVLHTIRHPNTATTPSVRNPNLPITVKVTKSSADATNLTVRCGSLTAGTSSPVEVDVINYNEATWTSATPDETTIETSALGAGSATVSVAITGTISAGVVTFEYSPEGVTWYPMRLTNPSGSPIGLFADYPLANGNFTTSVFVGGYLKFRARLSTPVTGAGSVRVMLRPSLGAVSRHSQVYQRDPDQMLVTVAKTTATHTASGSAPAAVAVGATSTSVLAANVARRGLVLTNTSNRVISLGLNGAAAVLNSGITLQPGGVWVMDSFTFTTGAITAISTAGSTNLAVQEFV